MNRIYVAVFTVLYFLVSAPLLFAQTRNQEVRAFNSADRNNDRVLNRGEFEKFINLMAAAGNAQAKRAKRFGALGYSTGFKRADTNSDGKVTGKELERMR